MVTNMAPTREMKRFHYLLLIFLAAVTACQTADEVAVEVTAISGAIQATATPISTNTAVAPNTVAPSSTPIPDTEPATATGQPTSAPTQEPTATSEETASPTTTATVMVTDTETAVTTGTATTATVVATATQAAPPPSDDVTQPPYEASSCSDKYPCNDDQSGWEARIRVPTNFEVSYYGRVNAMPTSITFGPNGRLYIATMQGTIYEMDNGGGANPHIGGFIVPTGIAFQPGTNRLYVSSRVVDQNIGGEAKVSVVEGGGVTDIITGLPCCYTSYHSANGIAFGPDGWGYVGVGGRADHGEILEGPNKGEQDELHPLEASILRFSPDGSVVEPYARGFRNPYDIAWDANGQLWASDNTPDFDPPERLHRVVPGGQHGYPYYDCDVCFSPPPGVTVIPPAVTFAPSSSPTGVAAYLANQFPGYYNSLFVTLWSAFPGAQKVMHVGPGGGAPRNFATGFAAPIDVTVGPDGSLYVADWATGIIFKISYTG